jgi:hypothetical protein
MRRPACRRYRRPGVLLARFREDVLALRRQHLEERAAVLVTAVLRPESAEHAELDLVRLAVEQVDDAVVLLARQ